MIKFTAAHARDLVEDMRVTMNQFSDHFDKLEEILADNVARIQELESNMDALANNVLKTEVDEKTEKVDKPAKKRAAKKGAAKQPAKKQPAKKSAAKKRAAKKSNADLDMLDETEFIRRVRAFATANALHVDIVRSALGEFEVKRVNDVSAELREDFLARIDALRMENE
jgi:hypothetical protein